MFAALNLKTKIYWFLFYFFFFCVCGGHSTLKFNILDKFLSNKTQKNNWLRSIQLNDPKTPDTKQTEAEKKTHVK